MSRLSSYTGWHIKKWTISFLCLQCVHHTHTENFYNISTVPKTLIKIFTLCCNNWSQSFPKHSDCPINQSICQTWTCLSVTAWMTSQRIFNMNNIAKYINSLLSPNPISGIYIIKEWNHCWATIYVNYILRLRGGPLFSAPLCS